MRHGKSIVYFFTAIFLLAAVLIGTMEAASESDPPFWVQVCVDGAAEKVACWKKGESEFVVFLPGCADLSRTRIRVDAGKTVSMDGRELRDGMTCDGFDLNKVYEMACNSGGENRRFRVTFLRSDSAAMYIDVPTGSMDYIHAKKGNEESGTLRLYSPDGAVEYSGNLKSIKGRGNSSWEEEKKSYNLTFFQETDLLGMGQARKWVLFANAADHSNMRNKIVGDFAEATGLAYSADSRWVDVYLNGEYAGLYLLSERNEVHSQRVDVAWEGSFLVSQEMESRLREQKYPYISTASGQALRIHYSDWDTAELETLWQSAENAILAGNGVDPVTGKHWQELIDLDSWAMKYLIEEGFGNVDAGYISQFYYLDGSAEKGRICAGPVWDYDLSMGNNECWRQTGMNGLFANRLLVREGVETGWFPALYQKEEFYSRMTELYQSVFRPQLVRLLEEGLDAYAEQISQAAEMNRVRWLGEEETLTAQTEEIRTYLTQRMAFLDDLWINGTEYCVVQVREASLSNYSYYAIRPGECLTALPGGISDSGSVFGGWYYADTGEAFDMTQTIWEDTVIYGKRTSSKLYTLVKTAPSAAMAAIFFALLIADGWRTKRTGKYGKTQRTKISP